MFQFGGDDMLDISAFGFEFLTDIVPLIRETTGGEVYFKFGAGDVLKLVGFPLLFLDDGDLVI